MRSNVVECLVKDSHEEVRILFVGGAVGGVALKQASFTHEIGRVVVVARIWSVGVVLNAQRSASA